MISGRSPVCNYSINGRNFSQGYWLVDGIYPSWSIFVAAFKQPQGEKGLILRKNRTALGKMLKERMECFNQGSMFLQKHAKSGLLVPKPRK